MTLSSGQYVSQIVLLVMKISKILIMRFLLSCSCLSSDRTCSVLQIRISFADGGRQKIAQNPTLAHYLCIEGLWIISCSSIISKRVMLHPQNNLEYFYKQTFIKSCMVQNFGACLWSCFNSYSSRNMIGHITYSIHLKYNSHPKNDRSDHERETNGVIEFVEAFVMIDYNYISYQLTKIRVLLYSTGLKS